MAGNEFSEKQAVQAPTGDYLGIGIPMSQLQAQYAKWLGKFLIGTAATGAAVSGTLGLKDILGYNLTSGPKAPDPLMINVPYKAQPKTVKQASVLDSIYNWLTNKTPPASPPPVGLGEWFLGGGHDVKTVTDIPAAIPAALLGGAASFYTGKKLMDKFVGWHKQRMVNADAEDARQDYENALLQQFKPLPAAKITTKKLQEPVITKAGETLTQEVLRAIMTKQAEDGQVLRIAQKLDELAASVGEQKEARWRDYWDPTEWSASSFPGSLFNPLAGAYATIAPVLALGSGAAMYHFAKDTDPEKDLAKKIRKHQLERWAKRPPDVFANLVPVDASGKPVKEHDDEVATPTVAPQAGHKIASVYADEINTKAAAFVRELLGV